MKWVAGNRVSREPRSTIRLNRWLVALCALILIPVSWSSARAASSESVAKSGGTVVVASYGGTFADAQRAAYFKPFTAATGIKVVETTDSGFAKAKAQEQSGNIEWDVTSADGASFASEVSNHLLQKLNRKTVNLKDIERSVVSPYGVGYIEYSMNMAWSKAKYGNAKLTPADFFNTAKYPGKRVLPADPSQTLEFALLASGVKPNKLYPLNVDRAINEIKKIKSSIIGFKGASDEQALVSQGEVDMALLPNGRIANAITAGAKWAYTWKDAIIVTENWAVLKGAPHLTNAMKFINFAMRAKQQATLAKIIPYGPTNKKAFGLLSSKLAKSLPSYPANRKQGVLFNAGWWAKNLSKVQDKWNALMLG